MSATKSNRSFYDAQEFVGDNCYVYIISGVDFPGAAVSCYFWFEDVAQLLDAVRRDMSFWEWGNGWEAAQAEINKIVDTFNVDGVLGDGLRRALDRYARANAGISLYAWGSFESLFSGCDSFSKEIRSDFRKSCDRLDDEREGVEDQSRPICDDEMDDFLGFLGQSAR